MGEQGTFALRPDDGVAIPVAEPRLGRNNRGALSDVDAMRDYASTGVLSTAPGIVLATPPQEPPEVAVRPLVLPDHPIDPFVAEWRPALGLQPEAELLRTPAFGPQLARLAPDLRLSGLRRALRLLKAVTPLPRVSREFPAHRSLAHPERLADLGLGNPAFCKA